MSAQTKATPEKKNVSSTVSAVASPVTNAASASNASAATVTPVKTEIAAVKETAREVSQTAANVASKSKQATLSAVNSTQKTAEHAVSFGSESVKEMLGDATREMQKMQEIFTGYAQEWADQIIRATDVVARNMNEMINTSRDNMEACIETANIAGRAAREMASESFSFSNQLFADNVEISKNIFTCRTINDLFELHGRMFKVNVDNSFNQSVKFSEMMFDYATEVAEPVNERMAVSFDRFSKLNQF
jgi:phasin family protein